MKTKSRDKLTPLDPPEGLEYSPRKTRKMLLDELRREVGEKAADLVDLKSLERACTEVHKTEFIELDFEASPEFIYLLNMLVTIRERPKEKNKILAFRAFQRGILMGE